MFYTISVCLLVVFSSVTMTGALTTAEIDKLKTGKVNVIETTSTLIIQSTGIPDHDTPDIKCNPNTATEQTHNFTVLKVPRVINPPGCLHLGAIGIAINGVVLFNPWTGDLYNAVEGDHKEDFDPCDGHADVSGTYHYHQIPSCLVDNTRDQFLGVALDGFPIYGAMDENGNILTTADLDFCHGRTNANEEYRYHMTSDFPYILGCFHGEVSRDRPDRVPPAMDDQPMKTLPEECRPPGGDRQPPSGGDRQPPPGGDRQPPPGGDRQPPPGGDQRDRQPGDDQLLPPRGDRPMPKDTCLYGNVSNPALLFVEDSVDSEASVGGASHVTLTMIYIIVTILVIFNISR